MKLRLEIEAEDALDLLKIHTVFAERAALNIGEDPLLYSKMAGIFNRFFAEVFNRIPMDELDRINQLKNNPTT